MTAFKMSKYAPYRSIEEYLKLRPSYVFEGRSAESWVADAICQCFPDDAGGTLAECGAGPGPLWKLLPRNLKILAIEPNRALWSPNYQSQVTYCEQDGFQFLVEHPGKVDVIAWMWALNYPLLAFFEEYEPHTRTVTRKDWIEGHHHCLDRLVQILKVRCQAKWVVLFFDDASVEQDFVMRVWKDVAPNTCSWVEATGLRGLAAGTMINTGDLGAVDLHGNLRLLARADDHQINGLWPRDTLNVLGPTLGTRCAMIQHKTQTPRVSISVWRPLNRARRDQLVKQASKALNLPANQIGIHVSGGSLLHSIKLPRR